MDEGTMKGTCSEDVADAQENDWSEDPYIRDRKSPPMSVCIVN